MAAIDFPNSPTDGQLFNAPNGVTYQWNAARTLWLPVPSTVPNPALGDFCAYVYQTAIGTSLTVVTGGSVLSGNVGSWYNPSNGRFTPPAGRYFLYGYFTGTSTAATHLFAYFYKNGVQLAPGSQAVSIAAATYYGGPSIGMTVDANGTDYFQMQVISSAANTSGTNIIFGAIPVGIVAQYQGVQGLDFCAYSASASIPGTATVAIPNTILSGNTGGYYNPANGRYTPPAGRYYIRASFIVPSTSTAVGLQVNIRKNGTNLPGAYGGQVPGAAGWWGDPAQAAIVDANGTDYFDMTVYAGSAQTGAIQFMAFPLGGVVGPQGPQGPPGTGPANSDFWAATPIGTNYGLSTSETVITGTPVQTGNVGGYYNATTGRFTPPAGRYMFFAHAVMGWPSGAIQTFLYLRKNGVHIAMSEETPSNSGYYNTNKLSAIVDANGSDYFDLTGQGNATGGIYFNLSFGATPTMGLPGPQGPMGPTGTAFPSGTVVDFAGPVAPTGWYLCDGSVKSQTTDAALYAAIGAYWNIGGEGTGNFRLPDLRGRGTIGLDPGGTAGRVTSGVSGVASQTLGATGGDQNLTGHAHGAGSLAGAGLVGNNLTNGTTRAVGTADGTNSGFFQNVAISGSTANAGAGGSQNMPPVAVMQKIIKA